MLIVCLEVKTVALVLLMEGGWLCEKEEEEALGIVAVAVAVAEVSSWCETTMPVVCLSSCFSLFCDFFFLILEERNVMFLLVPVYSFCGNILESMRCFALLFMALKKSM